MCRRRLDVSPDWWKLRKLRGRQAEAIADKHCGHAFKGSERESWAAVAHDRIGANEVDQRLPSGGHRQENANIREPGRGELVGKGGKGTRSAPGKAPRDFFIFFVTS